MLLVRLVISVLCAVGFYASVFMLRKSVLDAQGRLTEPSVVQSPRAKLFGGVPNAFVGTLYYPALAAVSWAAHSRGAFTVAFAACVAAAATSLFLAYSLLFVTKRNCVFCFISHGVNVALVGAVARLLVLAR
ncbi:MAG TPA: vitamin K epoxide reductase family protein [Candidatus Baltobacteraceae bacterium]|nr:vitamin K epoxide reductase family protein [Candidatus Baltobacteraceae bacterium]